MEHSSSRATNASGRHPLPSRRPSAVATAQRPSSSFRGVDRFGASRNLVPQPHTASAATESSIKAVTQQNQAEAMPAPQSTAMERQVSRPYINTAASPPYRNLADAIRDQRAILMGIEQQNNRHMDPGPQPNSTDAADELAQQCIQAEDPTRSGKAGNGNSASLESPEEEAAWILLRMSRSAIAQTQASPATARPEPNHKSPTTHSPGDDAVAPGNSTQSELIVHQQRDFQRYIPQHHLPSQHPPQQVQGSQGSQASKKTIEDDGHTDGSASSWLTNSGTTRPPVNPKPQLKRKRKGDQGLEKKEAKKKTAKANGRKPKEEKPRPFVCPCGRDYTREDHLTRHQKGVHGAGRFQCDVCLSLFTRKDNTRQHRRKIHPNAGPAPVPKSVIVIPDGTILANAHVTWSALVTANGQAQPAGRETERNNEDTEDNNNPAHPGDEKVQDSESPSRTPQNGGSSTSTPSSGTSLSTTTTTGSKFKAINK